MSRFLVVAFALVFPAAALAQPGDDPTAPESDQTPPPIVIQPTTPAPRTAYVTELPRYETYYESWNRPLFASGAIVFLTAYGASAIVAGTSADDVIDRGNDHLYIPVAGPWMALNDRPACGPLMPCERETLKQAFLVADGVMQAGGVLTMVAGLLQAREHRVLVNPVASRSFRITPTASSGGPGVRLSGVF